MRLGRTQDNLEILLEKDNITIEEAFKFFASFCEDIKSESGKPIEQQDVGNVEETLKKVRWIGRVAVRIYEKNQENIKTAASKERFEQLIGEIHKADEKENEIQEQLALISENNMQLKEKIQVLKEKKEKKEEEVRTANEKQQEYEQLKKQLEICKNIDIPQMDKMSQELQGQISQWKAVYEIKKVNLEDIERINKEEKNKCDDLIRKNSEMEELLKAAKKDREHIEIELLNKEEELNKIQDVWNKTRGENKDIQEKIERIKEYLNNSDIQKLRIDYQEALEDKEKLDKEYRELEKELRFQKSENDRLENIKWEKNEEKESAQEDYGKIEKEIKKIQHEKESICQEIQRSKKRLQDLKEWHQGADSRKYEQELKDNLKLCNILEEARQAMEEDLGDLLQGQNTYNQEIQRYFRDELRVISEKLRIYQKKYQASIETLPYRNVLK